MQAQALTHSDQSRPAAITILAVDGGGVRGIIPARILQEIETKTQQPVARLFDFAAGTSTGGLVTLLTATPDNTGGVLYTARDIVAFYRQFSQVIFHKSWGHTVATGNGLWGAKYSRQNFDQCVQRFFGVTRLSQTLYPVCIPAYAIQQASPLIFSTKKACQSGDNDFYIRDVAAATSAAPTYFAPKIVTNITESQHYRTADGGLFANNPEIVAAISLYHLFPHVPVDNVRLISLGTGTPANHPGLLSDNGLFGWLARKGLVNRMTDAESELTATATGMLFPNHYRLQLTIPAENAAMDNASASNINQLLSLTEKYLTAQAPLIDEICNLLSSQSSSCPV